MKNKKKAAKRKERAKPRGKLKGFAAWLKSEIQELFSL